MNNMNLFLPSYVRLEDLANAIVKLYGGNLTKNSLFSSHSENEITDWCCGRDSGKFIYGVPIKDIEMPSVDEIKNALVSVTDSFVESPTFVFKDVLGNSVRLAVLLNTGFKGERLLTAPSNFKWLALGKKLAKVFGGILVFSESDDSMKYKASKPLITKWAYENKKDGFAYRQNIIFNLKPISIKEYVEANTYAYYTQDFNDKNNVYIERLFNAVKIMDARSSLETKVQPTGTKSKILKV